MGGLTLSWTKANVVKTRKNAMVETNSFFCIFSPFVLKAK